jgi:hypothetical protein
VKARGKKNFFFARGFGMKHLFKPSGEFHLHGLIFKLKERMNSRQDRPVKQKKKNFSLHVEANFSRVFLRLRLL